MGNVVPLPRRLFRKIAVRRTRQGWVAQLVGFDGHFYTGQESCAYPERWQAVAAARNAARICGAPCITIETLTQPGGPERVA